MFAEGIVDDCMVWRDLFLGRILQILQSGSHLAQIDVTETPIEQDLAREEPEFQAQLVIVN